MSQIIISYIDLSPGLENKFINQVHKIIISTLRESTILLDNFSRNYPEYNLGLIIVTENGIKNLLVKGPTVIKKMKRIDYSIFLPENIKNISHYIDLVFEGISIIMENYGLTEIEILDLKNKCEAKITKR